MKVFLGGTCNNSTWRDELIPKLKIDYFNPVVKDWTPECMEEEIKQRQECDICLYVITPLMKGVYSIAEVVDDSNKRPDKVVFSFIDFETIGIFSHDYIQFDSDQLKSLEQVGKMIRANGGKWVEFQNLAKVLNNWS